MFFSVAYAASDAAATRGGEMMSTLVNFGPIVLIMVVFYFILIRPQQQQQKTLRNKLSAIKRGDRIVTGGGMIGTVAKATDGGDEVEVDLAPNVRVVVLRNTITNVLTEAKNSKVAGNTDSDKKTAK